MMDERVKELRERSFVLFQEIEEEIQKAVRNTLVTSMSKIIVEEKVSNIFASRGLKRKEEFDFDVIQEGDNIEVSIKGCDVGVDAFLKSYKEWKDTKIRTKINDSIHFNNGKIYINL